MNIKEFKESALNTKCELEVMLKKKTYGSSEKAKWFDLEISDLSGSISGKRWSSSESSCPDLVEGIPYKITCVRKEYNGNPQFYLEGYTKSDLTAKDFIPTYEITNKYFSYFDMIFQDLAEPYKTLLDTALDYTNRGKVWQAFIECPSASKYHGAKLGGLFLHTIGVLRNCVSISIHYLDYMDYVDCSKVINKDRLLFLAIYHDIMKIKDYEWQTSIIYKESTLCNHVYRGMSYLELVNIKAGRLLSEEELQICMYSLLCHHGEYGREKLRSAEDYILHLADMLDGKIIGFAENSK
jgi:23S rRNA maturation-related 3'-5' exoribonuclease YhaM